MPRQTPPENETSRDRFKRIAGYRTARAIESIRNIGGTANENNYEYTDDQVRKIIGALTAEIETLQETFRNKGKVTAKVGFTL